MNIQKLYDNVEYSYDNENKILFMFKSVCFHII